MAHEGDFWLTNLTTRLRDSRSYIIYDLGGPRPIRCAHLQGDNNDSYQIDGSVNGDKYFPMFIAPPTSQRGMRTRTLKLVATARFVRVQAHGGDGSYSLSELGMFSACPDPWPFEPQRMTGTSILEDLKVKLGWLAATSIVFIFFIWGRRLVWITVATACVPLALAGSAAGDLYVLYPFTEQEPMVRGVIAAIAGSLAVRKYLLPKLAPLNRTAFACVLAALAVLSVACYYHFGAAQFWHDKEGRRTYVHSYDMRHYFPVAKYFHELRFDGLYAGSFAAFLELKQLPFERLAHQQFRDLRVSQMKPASEMRGHVEEVRARFSQPRWDTFKADIRTFVDIMGERAFLDNMNDHGGNATPVWLLGASAILHSMPATETTLILTGLIDPLLLAIMFFAIGRVFGWPLLGFVLVLFGATDFYQFGSNLMGSMLRQDWLVALGLAACAYRRSHYVVAGTLFAYAGLIRAFPAMATFFLATPALWWVAEWIWKQRRLPTWAQFSDAHHGTIRAALGAIGCVLMFAVASVMIFGVDAWTSWAEKISIHAQDVSVNNVGLRNVMAYDPTATARKLVASGQANPWGIWEDNFFANLRNRAVIYYAFMLAYLALTLVAVRRRRPESAALIGLTTIPFLFYPSNYYMHLIFLLPLAVPVRDTPERFGQWTALLCVLCLGQYASYGWARNWTDEFFTYQSFMLLGTFIAMLVPLALGELKKTTSQTESASGRTPS